MLKGDINTLDTLLRVRAEDIATERFKHEIATDAVFAEGVHAMSPEMAELTQYIFTGAYMCAISDCIKKEGIFAVLPILNSSSEN